MVSFFLKIRISSILDQDRTIDWSSSTQAPLQSEVFKINLDYNE